jgi:hypothetical protein
MGYEYSDSKKVMIEDEPLVIRDDVLGICKEIDEDTPEAETTEFILAAHIYLCNTLDGWGIAPSLMKRIEMYLSAHFAAITYSVTQRSAIGPLSQSFMHKIDLGFDHTRYGQMAKALDPTGTLGTKRRPVSMVSLGSGILTS